MHRFKSDRYIYNKSNLRLCHDRLDIIWEKKWMDLKLYFFNLAVFRYNPGNHNVPIIESVVQNFRHATRFQHRRLRSLAMMRSHSRVQGKDGTSAARPVTVNPARSLSSLSHEACRLPLHPPPPPPPPPPQFPVPPARLRYQLGIRFWWWCLWQCWQPSWLEMIYIDCFIFLCMFEISSCTSIWNWFMSSCLVSFAFTYLEFYIRSIKMISIFYGPHLETSCIE